MFHNIIFYIWVLNYAIIMNTRKLFIISIAGLTLLSACQKDTPVPAPDPQPEQEAPNFFVKGIFAEQKTSLDNNDKFVWGSDESICLYYNDGADHFVASQKTSEYKGEKEANFGFRIDLPDEADKYVLGGIYPASAVEWKDNGNPEKFKVVLPVEQEVGINGEYDPNAQIMLASPRTLSSFPAQTSYNFKGRTAITRINISSIQEEINEVEISIPGKKISGGRYVNLKEPSVGEFYAPESTIRLKLKEPVKGSVNLYFSSWEFNLNDGETMTVTAANESKYYWVNKVHSGSDKTFGVEKINYYNVDFSRALSSTRIPGEPSDLEILAMARTDVPNTAFYKDAFLDGGVHLNPGVKVNGEIVNGLIPHAVPYIGIDAEYFLSGNDDAFDTPVDGDLELQNQIITYSTMDTNGALLYPDNSPRFRLLYIFGGSSGRHGSSLGSGGRSRMATFYNNGGCYAGSCAGAYLAGKYASGGENDYLNIWTGGNMIGTGLSGSSTSCLILPGSPLLNYYDFGGDLTVEAVRHNGGGYMDTKGAPQGTEILARFGVSPDDVANAKYVGKPMVWAYKASINSGRLCVCGSHPEDGADGDRRDLTAAIFRYAYDGVGIARAKGVLHNGEERVMNKLFLQNSPEFAAIGDKQCHHFLIYLKKKAENFKLELKGTEGYDLQLFLKKDSFAFPDSNPDYTASGSGTDRSINVASLDEGLWYVTVRCNTTVDATLTCTHPTLGKGWRFVYSGATGVLNGVPYSVKAEWK